MTALPVFSNAGMSNNTTCSISDTFSISHRLEDREREYHDIYVYINLASYAIILVFAPVAVAGNALILAAIWKKSFQKKPFHIILSGLAFTDLFTGLTSPLLAVPFFLWYLGKWSVFLKSMSTIGRVITVYLVAFTLLMITLMSVERWLHMSRRSLVTSRRGYITAAMLPLVPIPLVVLSVLNGMKRTLVADEVCIAVYMVCCYLTTSVVYFKVYRIIRQHQQQVQGHQPHQNFGQPAIDFAKYKKSVVTILYILALFSVCFLPMIVWLVVLILMGYNTETWTAYSVSLLLLFLSSSLNPGLYIWRMKDVREGVKKLFCTNG